MSDTDEIGGMGQDIVQTSMCDLHLDKVSHGLYGNCFCLTGARQPLIVCRISMLRVRVDGRGCVDQYLRQPADSDSLSEEFLCRRDCRVSAMWSRAGASIKTYPCGQCYQAQSQPW